MYLGVSGVILRGIEILVVGVELNHGSEIRRWVAPDWNSFSGLVLCRRRLFASRRRLHRPQHLQTKSCTLPLSLSICSAHISVERLFDDC